MNLFFISFVIVCKLLIIDIMKIFFQTTNRWLLLAVIVSFLFFSSCYKEKDFDFDKMAKNQYESEWAIPVIHKKYFLSDMIVDSSNHIVSDNNHFLTIVHFTGDLWTATAEDLFVLNDQMDSYSATVPAPASAPLNYYELNFSNPINFNYGTLNEIDSIHLKSGYIQAIINTNINHNCELTIEFPEIKSRTNNQNLSLYFPMQSSGHANPASGTATFSLLDYNVKFSNPNQLQANYNIKVYADGQPFDIPSYTFNANFNINDLKFKSMFGYFGQVTDRLSDTVSIKLFKHHFENSIQLKEVKAHLLMKNSFGAPLQFTVNNFSIYTGGEERLVMTPGYQVEGPFPTFQQFGQTVMKTDSTFLNPNVLEISPKHMAFDAIGVLNPANNPLIRNFVTDKSKFSIDARLEFPMEGNVNYFSYVDTIEFFFESIDQIEFANFRVYVENAFPINADMQIYFTDTAHVVLDSLLVNRSLIPSAQVGPAPHYYTSTPGIKTLDIVVDKTRLAKLANTKWLVVYARLRSFDSPSTFVKLYSNQYLYVTVGTRVKIKAEY